MLGSHIGVAVSALAVSLAAGPQAFADALSCPASPGPMTLIDVQAVGSHNSYKRAIPEAELALIAASSAAAAEGLDYFHSPLADQLDLGMRQLELDVLHDPEGGRFADPLLPRLTAGAEGAQVYDAEGMDAPGFKVMHTQDIDVYSHCATLIACLETVDAWSRANADHVPLLILINLKTGSIGVPGSTDALPFTPEAYAALDAEIRSVFGPERLITPDAVRGDAATLREGVLAGGWPALEESRGKLAFALDTGADNVRTYVENAPSLEGRVMFVNSLSDAADHAAYFTMNDPLAQGDLIAERVAAGFLVRTRADANTVEARTGDTTRREAAFNSGAQYVSTDYYEPRTEWSDYSVRLPGGVAARCNPVRTGSAR